MPEVSIVIPFRDRVDWAVEAVESVLCQTFRDFEIILVDDGSLENHEPRFRSLDERIVYVRQENRGPAAARNHGITLARGRFIAFLDADDLFVRNKLAIQIQLMRERPSVALSHTSYWRMNADGSSIDVVPSGDFSGCVYPKILTGCPVATPSVMVRREVFDAVRFDETLRVAEDTVLWIQIARSTDFLGIPLPLTLVRMHGRNAAYDGDAQVTGLKSIIDLGVKTDQSLGYFSKRRVLSGLYFELSQVCRDQNRRALRHKYLLMSFFTYPVIGRGAWSVKRMIHRSTAYYDLSERHRMEGRTGLFYKYLVLSAVSWPLNPRPYVHMAVLSIPPRARRRIKILLGLSPKE